MKENTIITLINNSVKQSSNRMYASVKTDKGWIGYTFKQMQDNAEALAVYFKDAGYKMGEKLAILADGSHHWINAEFATFMNRMVAVPMSYKLLPSEVLFRLEHSESKILALSSFTKDLGVEVLKMASTPIKILWLDNNKDEAKALVRETNLADDMLVYIEEAIEKGKNILKQSSIKQELKENLNQIKANDLAVISYSSGTTGNPKGVMLSHGNLYDETMACGKWWYVPLNSFKQLLVLPCDHAFGHTAGIFFGLARGITLYFVDTRGGLASVVKNFPINLAEIKPDFVLVVPALAQNMMKKVYATIKQKGDKVNTLFNKALDASIAYNGNMYNKVSLGIKLKNFIPKFILGDLLFFPKIRKSLRAKFLVGGGAYFDAKLQAFFYALGIPLYQGYGLSEASPAICTNVQTVGRHKIGTCGKELPVNTVKIVDENGLEVANGKTGEITAKGSNVMLGYYKNDKETALTIKNGYLYTGDMGYKDNDGFINVVGRSKALLISKDGEKYSPEAIEEAIVATSNDVVSQVLLYSEHNPYVSALINIDTTALANLIKQKFTTNTNYTEVFAYIDGLIFAYKSNVSYHFPNVWQASTYCLMDKAFEVNSTFKIMRFKAFELFKSELNYMYTSDGSKSNNPHNRDFIKNIFDSIGLKIAD